MFGRRCFTTTAAVCALAPAAWAQQSVFVIQHGTIVTVSGPTIQDGSVVIKDGKIAEVGPTVTVPPGASIIDARGLTVYPGLFDADSVLGMESPVEAGMGQFTPHLLPSTSFVVESEKIPRVRLNGVTEVQAHPTRGIIPGQGEVFSLAGWTPDEMLIKRRAALILVFPSVGDLNYTDDERYAVTPYSVTRAQYDRRLGQVRDFFASARTYMKAKQEAGGGVGVGTDESFEAMIPALERKVPVIIETINHVDIKNAVQFAREQNLDYLIASLSGAWRVADFLKENGARVILGDTQRAPDAADDANDIVSRTAAILHQKGVPFAIATLGDRLADPQLLPYSAGNAVSHGLPYAAGLRSVTLTPAEFLGVADQVGSIERGKIANLVVASGDIFERRTEVRHLFINGKPVSPESKDLRLYEKYRNRPASR